MVEPTEDRKTAWVCVLCGKLSWDRYGEETISHGWDAACALNSVLVYFDAVVFDGSLKRAVEIRAGGLVETAEAQDGHQIIA